MIYLIRSININLCLEYIWICIEILYRERKGSSIYNQCGLKYRHIVRMQKYIVREWCTEKVAVTITRRDKQLPTL